MPTLQLRQEPSNHDAPVADALVVALTLGSEQMAQTYRLVCAIYSDTKVLLGIINLVENPDAMQCRLGK